MWDMKCDKPAHKACGHWQNAEKREEERDSERLPTGRQRARVKLPTEKNKGK